MKAWQSASSLEHVKYNHFRETYILDVDEWDVNTHDAIDAYDCWVMMTMNDAGSGSSHRCQVISVSATTLMILTKNHAEIWTTCHAGCQMSVRVENWRSWGLRLGREGNGSIEFRNSGQEECNQLGVPFFYLFSFLFHSSLHDWISTRYKWRHHGFLPPLDRSQVEVEFPSAPDPPKGYRTVPICSGTSEFVWVRMWHDCIMLSFHSFPFLLYSVCSPAGLRLKRWIL